MYIYQRLCKLFRDNPDTVLTYRYLYEVAWNVPWIPSCQENLRSFISLIRPLLPGQITSVRGQGYLYLPDDVFGKEKLH